MFETRGRGTLERRHRGAGTEQPRKRLAEFIVGTRLRAPEPGLSYRRSCFDDEKVSFAVECLGRLVETTVMDPEAIDGFAREGEIEAPPVACGSER